MEAAPPPPPPHVDWMTGRCAHHLLTAALVTVLLDLTEASHVEDVSH